MQTLRECGVDLSVIIPVYNLERFLDPMLKSLRDQDLGDYSVEIVFVLNNCTDKSEDVIRSSGLDCRILYCDIQGCGPARNVGLDDAHGEYVWFMDGDDWLLSGTAIRDAMDKAKGRDILRVSFLSDTYPFMYFSMVWQYILRMDFVREFRFPNKQPQEDDEYMDQVLRKAGYNRTTYMFLPHADRPLYYYNYLREGSNMYRYSVLGEPI